MAPLTPVSTLRFSHGDQMVAAALDGSGVAMGSTPHLTRLLLDGILCAPFGPDAVVIVGSFWMVARPRSSGREHVSAFIEWLRDEARREEESLQALYSPRPKRLRSVARGGD